MFVMSSFRRFVESSGCLSGRVARTIVCGAIAPLLVSHPASSQSLSLADGLVSITDLNAVNFGDQEFSWIDAAAFANGDLAIADMYTGTLVRVGRDNDPRWRIGGEGEGPGEFGRLYRVSVGPGDKVVAFDLERREVSFFSGKGVFLHRVRLNLPFRQVDSVLMPSDSLLIVSGTTGLESAVADYAIHLFDAEGSHISSFGPLPATDQREVLAYWGAGIVRLAGNGELLYTRRLPYEVYRFSANGELIGITAIDVPTTGRPEDRYNITRNGPRGAYHVQRTDAVITYPIATVDIGDGMLLSSRWESDERRFLTLIEEGGSVLADLRLDRGEGILLDAASDAGVIWLSDSSSGFKKVLLRGGLMVATERME